MSDRYPFHDIEPKWQRLWEERKTFQAVDGAAKPKAYILDMFPYPSGAGLHVGHPEGYTATDIMARFRRMRGENVLHPMGWDAFGLPAEQYAIETGTHPSITTKRNIETFTRQIKRLGFSYDWSREINTTDPAYFKWTQWIFLKLHERGLAYMADAPVWWCPACGTVLANEEVVDGKCERKGHPVERRPMRQWMLKITAYAERLLADLEGLDWPDHIKEQQRHWIGRSEGAEVVFIIGEAAVRVFTTRPDTLFGATYLVLAPEHPLVPGIATAAQRPAVDAYRRDAARRSDMERAELTKKKTGVFTGAYAVNPVNDKQIPVWIADYVLASYGTGAIMAVPAHDQRDFEFATRYQLPVHAVIVPEDGQLPDPLTEAFEEPGRMHDSSAFTGLRSEDGKGKVVAWLASRKAGAATVTYRLRDWLFSRQRYWGEPIPIVHCATCGTVPLPESALPLTLPEMTDFKPTGTGEPPLAKAAAWVKTSCPKCRGPAGRETNTMPQWAGSCWYYLRYLDPHNDVKAWDPAKERYWMPVDLYVGGAEHAVLHLLYSRFWHKVLYDLKLVSTSEPFQKLVNQGMILGEDNEKMSKARGNVVNPDDIVNDHGADAFRLYEMFMGPLEAVKPWSTRSIEGIDRFLNRVWRLAEHVLAGVGLKAGPAVAIGLERKRHETIKRVTGDIETLGLNTAISALMEYVNALYEAVDLTRAGPPVPAAELRADMREALETLILLLSPFAPHVCEEIWERLGHRESLAQAPWPRFDPGILRQAEVTLVVQINGKVRARITVPAEATEEHVKTAALADAQVKKFLDGQPVKQFIVVPKRLVNIVTGMLVVLCALAGPAQAELIKLKSGEEVNAKIIKRTDKGVSVDWHGVPVTYWLADIESIDGEAAASSEPSGTDLSGASPLRGQAPALTPPLAAEDEALIRETIELSGLALRLEELQAQTQGGFKGHEDDERLKKLTPEQREQFLQILTTSFQPEQMRRDIDASFRRTFDRDAATAALVWLRSDAGRRLDEVERQPRTKEAMELFVAQLEQEPPPSARLQLARRYLEASQAADAAIELGVTVATSMARAMDTTGRVKDEEFQAGIRKAKQVYEEQYREQVESAVLANFLFTYRTVPDEDLTAYVGFLESDAGRWLSRTTMAALGDAMGGAAVEMSRKLLPMIEDAKRREQQEPASPAAP